MTEKQRLKALLQIQKQKQQLERAKALIEHGRRERLLMLERFEEHKKEMEKNAEKGLQGRVRGS